MNIPDKAVEAAAKAVYGDIHESANNSWDTAAQRIKDAYIQDARIALTAAYPHVEAATPTRKNEDAEVVAFFLALNPGLTFGDVDVSVAGHMREQYRRAREFFAAEGR